jgi:hypothetical protein
MLGANIEAEVRKILEKHGGYLRTHECSKKYAKGNKSLETKFYRWSKKVEKGKVKGFRIVKLPGNLSFIMLESMNLHEFLRKEKFENVGEKGLWEYLVKRFWEEEKLIEAAHLQGEYDLAYRAALNLTLKFPSPYKEKLLNETFQPIEQKLKEISAIIDPFKRVLIWGRFLGGTAIPKIIEDISKTLYEMSGGS